MMFFERVTHFFRVRIINGIKVLMSAFQATNPVNAGNRVILFNVTNGFMIIGRGCARI